VTLGCGAGAGAAPDAGQPPADASTPSPDASESDAAPPIDSGADVVTSAACTGDTLAANRNRLLETYYEYLAANAATPQTNGLSSSNVKSALDVWQKLDPSSRAVFLTLTARMQGSVLGKDGSSMLSHVVKVYRVVGGQGATSTDPGSCGGGEYNRMIMSMDAELHDVQVAANDHQGALQQNNLYDIADVVPSSYWRNSQDLGGPHTPFDLSDETNAGAPRAQTQYFRDTTSAAATAPLGRQDLATLVDPLALELDQDYDCVHNSNPLCEYITYGAYCIPEAQKIGTDVYVATYGDYGASWVPASCL